MENVIAEDVAHEATDIVEDSLGSTSIRLNLFGSGRAFSSAMGKPSREHGAAIHAGHSAFYDSGGNEIPLKPGKTWISIVPTNYTVTYQ